MLQSLGWMLPSPTWAVSRELPRTSLALGSCSRACRLAGPWLRWRTCMHKFHPTTGPPQLQTMVPPPVTHPSRMIGLPVAPKPAHIPAPASRSHHTRLRQMVLPVLACGGMEHPLCASAPCPTPCEMLADLQTHIFHHLTRQNWELGMVNRFVLIIPLYLPPTHF